MAPASRCQLCGEETHVGIGVSRYGELDQARWYCLPCMDRARSEPDGLAALPPPELPGPLPPAGAEWGE